MMFQWFGERLGLDTTLIVGVLSFMTATIACAIAAARSPASEARTWVVIACINGVFTLDLLTKARYELHNFVDQLLIANSLYQYRTLPQIIIIATFAAVFLIGVALAVKRTATRSLAARIAAVMTVAFIGFFGVEGISLHDVDRILWVPIYYIKVVGFVWAAGAAVITLAAIWRVARGPEVKPAYVRYQ